MRKLGLFVSQRTNFGGLFKEKLGQYKIVTLAALLSVVITVLAGGDLQQETEDGGDEAGLEEVGDAVLGGGDQEVEAAVGVECRDPELGGESGDQSGDERQTEWSLLC